MTEDQELLDRAETEEGEEARTFEDEEDDDV